MDRKFATGLARETGLLMTGHSCSSGASKSKIQPVPTACKSNGMGNMIARFVRLILHPH
jgi:hypothetical protein